MEVNALVRDEQLTAIWSYSSSLHRKSTIEFLAETFIGALRSLLEGSRSVDGPKYSPSDFPLTHLTQSDLDAALEEVQFDE